ncbi:lipid asymmetry maintenance protein MlaB [Comamonas sp. NoAH]|uniref:STAS domain-containing protein n=1 Tax=Comamonas halotolerans TaxID=3041496 RepID=UPI0024E12CBE|nr:STAS domain-containing protein [Comamonas sp. NoAH]
MQQTIALPSVLTTQAVVTARADMMVRMQGIPSGATIALDASAVQSFDSAGLALLLACRRAAQARQQSLHVQGWTPSLQSLAQVYGVLPLLDPEQAATQTA